MYGSKCAHVNMGAAHSQVHARQLHVQFSKHTCSISVVRCAVQAHGPYTPLAPYAAPTI